MLEYLLLHFGTVETVWDILLFILLLTLHDA